MEIKGKRVLITGGAGFLGRRIAERVWAKKPSFMFIPRKKGYDLTDLKKVREMMDRHRPNIVIHSAAYYGGIWINKKYPADIYFQNLIMGANIIEAAKDYGVEKFVGIGTACSYPGYLEGELKEENLWDGPCHESVRNYGMTKKMMQIQCEAYKKQYGFNGIHLLLANLYGEWDSYNPERSHVVAALIRKFVEAKKDNAPSVEVWGTGSPIREFLYVGDAADGIIKATELYDDTEPLNIGTGIGTSIRELVEMISEIVDFKGEIIWDSSKPDGQAKKIFDISKMKKELNWVPEISLKEGLRRTIEWFDKNYQKAIERW